MRKSFAGMNPADKIISKKTAEEPKTVAVEASEPKKEPEIRKTTPAKRKAGRPKTIDVERKNINIAVPVELLNKFDEVKTALGGNMTAYVVNLIKKDMDAKYKDYKDISSIQKDLGL